MPINWFPGHMNQARRLIRERLQRSDVLLEVLDARIPHASQNPLLARLRGEKPLLRVLTKSDLADEQLTGTWVRGLTQPGAMAIDVVSTSSHTAKRVAKACRKLVPQRGRPGFPVRVMIVGVPNVGKSTLFNVLAGKKKAEVADRPAVTRGPQELTVPGGLALIDTPGILWPKLEEAEVGWRLAATGAIRDSVFDAVEVAQRVLEYLRLHYEPLLRSRYNLKQVTDRTDELLEEIGRRRGCLTKGVGVDQQRAASLILQELRSGLLGRVTLEEPALQPGATGAGPVAQDEDASAQP